MPDLFEPFYTEIVSSDLDGNRSIRAGRRHVNIGPIRLPVGENIQAMLVTKESAIHLSESHITKKYVSYARKKLEEAAVPYEAYQYIPKEMCHWKEFYEEFNPKEGEFVARVDRISKSGNGIIDLQSDEINIGPVNPDCVGKEVVVEPVQRGIGRCKNEVFQPDDYERGLSQLTRSHGSSKRFDAMISSCNECGRVMTKKEDMWMCELGHTFEKSETSAINPQSNSDSKQNEDHRARSEENHGESKNQKDRDIEELRKEAELDSSEELSRKGTAVVKEAEQYNRSSKVKEYALARADGVCEGCKEPAPFKNKNGEPYLHIHHINELSKGGSDSPDSVVALCPNCHYRVHHGEDGETYNEDLSQYINNIET
jgi:hypothetical protein